MDFLVCAGIGKGSPGYTVHCGYWLKLFTCICFHTCTSTLVSIHELESEKDVLTLVGY